MGLGLLGARRLMDHFKIETAPGKGTLVELEQHLPQRAGRVTQASFPRSPPISSGTSAADPLEALRDQNRELLQSLEEIRRRDEESKQLNQELGDTNRGVVALYAELDERAEQLRKASELKSRFLSNMSHEFRTPLNSILALSRLLLDRIDGELTAEQERQIGYIRRSAESLLELVNDLLDLSKVEAGKVEVKPARFTVPSLFGALRGALKPLLTSPSVELIFDAADDMPELVDRRSQGRADPAQSHFQRAQIHRERRSARQRTLRAGKRRGDLRGSRYRHRHRGRGSGADFRGVFPDRHAPAEEGQRHRSRTAAVALARRVDRRHDPRRKRRRPGLGLHADASPRHSEMALRPCRAADLSRKRVLIIDDDETFRYVMKQIIRNEPRYEVLEASDGGDGLRQARDEQPDVIVLDLQMPNVDGFTVLQELNADKRTSIIPVIVSTSLAVDAELKARLPVGTRVISKNLISRENVSLFLRDATSSQGAS